MQQYNVKLYHNSTFKPLTPSRVRSTVRAIRDTWQNAGAFGEHVIIGISAYGTWAGSDGELVFFDHSPGDVFNIGNKWFNTAGPDGEYYQLLPDHNAMVDISVMVQNG